MSSGWPWPFLAMFLVVVVSISDVTGDNNCTFGESKVIFVNRTEIVYDCTANGEWVLQNCTSENDENCQLKRYRRQSGPTVGTACTENTECQTVDAGAYCSATKRCTCQSTFVNVNSYCWPKINPGQSGCQHTEQCQAVWPGTVCTPERICICPAGQPPYMTKDGPVCVSGGQCPTNSLNSKLRDETGNEKQCGGKDQLCMANLMYNCFCSPSPSPSNPNSCKGVTYCCPTRAFTCIMPSHTGVTSGSPPSMRYFYNSITGRCEQFSYRGAGGNANNFLTMEQCQSYCSTGCTRGNADYVQTPNLDYNQYSRRTCPPSCKSGYSCSSSNLCCPSSSNVCSVRGGVVATTPPSPFPDPGVPMAGIEPATRYYFDPEDGRCKSFLYNGAGGNFNNFLTDTHCRQYCSSATCSRGQPLLETSGIPRRCNTDQDCPSKYECDDSFCCPLPEYVCLLPVQTGNCLGRVTRYRYDSNVMDCVSFEYTGCQGNANNFPTYDSCRTTCAGVQAQSAICPVGDAYRNDEYDYITCGAEATGYAAVTGSCPTNYYCYNNLCCPTKAQICLMDRMDTGSPCLNAVTRWYYDSDSKICRTFSYKGCDGNSNNFATKVDCEDFCNVAGCPDGGEPYYENGRYKMCDLQNGNSDCPDEHQCTTLDATYGIRTKYCCPTKAYICASPLDTGVTCGGGSALNRFYFDKSSGRCKSFSYKGCQGNRNNFPNINICELYCYSSACPTGQAVVTSNPDTTSPFECNATMVDPCPGSSLCYRASLLKKSVCCGSGIPDSMCPSGQNAFFDFVTQMPLQCVANLGTCPTGYTCVYSPNELNGICCGVMPPQCPNGGSLLYDYGAPRQCTPALPGACPDGHRCQPVVIKVANVPSTMGFCCSVPDECGPGYVSQLVNDEPLECNSSRTCSPPYACLDGLCCAPSSAVTSVCPVGRTPLLSFGTPTLCQQLSTSAGCPAGYSCDFYAPGNVYYCCTAARVTLATTKGVADCPVGLSVLSPVRYCSPNNASSCPAGSFCTYSSKQGRFICCSNPSSVTRLPATTAVTVESNGTTRAPVLMVCPRGRTPAIDSASGAPRQCSHSAIPCPTGYSCVYSPNGDFCCTIGASNGCPNGTRVFLYRWTNTPLVCLPNSGRYCPSGFECKRSTVASIYQCCSTEPIGERVAEGDSCPAGAQMFLYPQTKTPLVCVPNGPSCPQGYSCLRVTGSGSYRCCSGGTNRTVLVTPRQTTKASATSRATANRVATTTKPQTRKISVCPGNGTPFLYRDTDLPLSCTSGGSACPAGFSCVVSDTYQTTICCKNGTAAGSTKSPAGDDQTYYGSATLAGEPCEDDMECREGTESPRASCRSGVCVCASNEVNYFGKCLMSGCPFPYRNLAGKCVIK